MDTPDKLEIARQRYQRLVEVKKGEIKDLEAKLQLLDEIESDTEEPQPPRVQKPATKVGFGLIDYEKYANMRLSEATLAALLDLHRNHIRDITRKRVAKHMNDHGFKSKGKNFLISVFTALKRLEGQGLVTSALTEGKRTYVPKDDVDKKLSPAVV